jgi:hypothetical protein
MLRVNPEVQPLRDLVGKRLLPPQDLAKAQVDLNRMLVTLWTAGFLELEPKPQPKSAAPSPPPASRSSTLKSKSWLDIPLSVSSQRIAVEPNEHGEGEDEDEQEADSTTDEAASRGYELESYRPDRVVPRPRLELLSEIRSVNPIYGLFLIGHLQFADECERIQALESVLELPANIAKTVRVPPPDQLPFGPLATDILHPKLLELGLAGVEEITGVREEDDDDSDSDRRSNTYEPPPRPLALGEKLRRLFDYDFPGVHDVYTRSVWVVSELLQFEGDFNKYILAHGLQKQEGMLFRHVLRFILLLNEISGIAPENTSPEDWEVPLDSIAERLIDACRRVDPQSTDEVLQELNDPKDERSRRRSS